MGRIVDPADLPAVVAEHRDRNERIAFTNGCFDLLHIGHVRYLQEARSLGDVLFVGLNSDESVRTLKGPNRPLIPEDERAEMLASLGAVDYVIVFGERTADTLIEMVRPDFYVKGGDVDPALVPEAPTVRRHGGAIVTTAKVEEHSTSNIVERVLSVYAAEIPGRKR